MLLKISKITFRVVEWNGKVDKKYTMPDDMY